MQLFAGLLGGFLLIFYLHGCSLAAPTHVKRAAPTHVKRDAEYRNALFDEYGCRIQKAAEAIRNKLDVS